MKPMGHLPTLSIKHTLLACETTLLKHYEQRLKGLILFGSEARQEITAASDIDLIVV